MAIVNVFGGFGFVGSEYCETTKEGYIKNYRDNYEVRSANCVYFISTVHNYNVLVDSQLDVHTNIVVLLKVLDNYRDYIKRTGEDGVFNFISSWFVYGKDVGFGENSRLNGIDEAESCEPKGFYSITKRCAEQLLVSYCETFGLKYRILRLANVLGKGDKKVSAQKNALQHLLGELKANRPIDLYDSGDFYRDYIDVRDCARAIDLVVREGEVNTIYNIGNGTPIAFRELIEYSRNKVGSKSEIRTIEQKDFHKKVQSSRSFFMDTTRLKSLGYKPQYTINQTLDDLLDDGVFPWLEKAMNSGDDAQTDEISLIKEIMRDLDKRLLEKDSSLVADLKSIPLEKLSGVVLVTICRFIYWKFQGTKEYDELIEMVRKTLESQGKDFKAILVGLLPRKVS